MGGGSGTLLPESLMVLSKKGYMCHIFTLEFARENQSNRVKNQRRSSFFNAQSFILRRCQFNASLKSIYFETLML